MRKWKRDCHLIKNKTVWKKEDGMTLIELMASLAILSVVILLVGSVHIFGQRQFINQTESASQANDLTYSLSVMSRDLRKLSVEKDSVIITINSIEYNGTTLFSLSDGDLLKNNSEVLATNVGGSFLSEIITIENEEKLIGVNVKLNTSGNGSKNSKDYQTTIYFRR